MPACQPAYLGVAGVLVYNEVEIWGEGESAGSRAVQPPVGICRQRQAKKAQMQVLPINNQTRAVHLSIQSSRRLYRHS